MERQLKLCPGVLKMREKRFAHVRAGGGGDDHSLIVGQHDLIEERKGIDKTE